MNHCNLSDALAGPITEDFPVPGRPFHLPLCSLPPMLPESVGFHPRIQRIQSVDESNFHPTQWDSKIPELEVKINPPPGGFFDDDDLPDPMIRLHAVAPGKVTYHIGEGVEPDHLVLEMPMFLAPIPLEKAPWWQQWVDANCHPNRLVYKNVDSAHLSQYLPRLISQQGLYGLSFPLSVTTEQEQIDYLVRFMGGDEEAYLIAEAGAVLGQAYDHPSDPASKMLRMRGYYYKPAHDPDGLYPNLMNPREFFHLLFGHDSHEALGHPLLRRLEQVGQSQVDLYPYSKRLRLRPPLRTYARVVFEAEMEANAVTWKDWKPGVAMKQDRIFNDHSRNPTALLHRGSGFKCNIFVSEICIRSGFRACVHPISNDRYYHYIDANSFANITHLADAGEDTRYPMTGRHEDSQRTWAYKIDNLLLSEWFQSLSAQAKRDHLNDLMMVAGRCFVVTGARRRKFRKYEVIEDVKGIADPVRALGSGRGIGHVVIAREFRAAPTFDGDATRQLRLETLEASGSGAESKRRTYTLGSNQGATASGGHYRRIHLIEMHPGHDPDHPEGLRDLNVRNSNRNLLGEIDEDAERAWPARLTHNPDGTERTDNMCCVDHYLPRNAAPTIEPCSGQ